MSAASSCSSEWLKWREVHLLTTHLTDRQTDTGSGQWSAVCSLTEGAEPRPHLVLTWRHEDSQLSSTSRLLSSVSASSFPDGEAANASTLSLPASSGPPPSLLGTTTVKTICLEKKRKTSVTFITLTLLLCVYLLLSSFVSFGSFSAALQSNTNGSLQRREQVSFAATIHQGVIYSALLT